MRSRRYLVFLSVILLVVFFLVGVSHAFASTGTTRVSVDSAGVPGNAFSTDPSISADGHHVAFTSRADNLVPGDTNLAQDVFVRDALTGSTSIVSVDSAGVQGDDNSGLVPPSISADGRYVAFESWADNLVPGDTNGSADIFVRDTVANTTTRVSVDSAGVQGDVGSWNPSISGNGRYVAFESNAHNLVPGDTNKEADVFVRDTLAGTTTRVSVDSAGGEGNAWSGGPSISADGRYVAFGSWADNLVPGDTNVWDDVFVRDTLAGTTTRVSVDSAGAEGDGSSVGPSISTDGRYVAFGSSADNLVPGDTNGTNDVFVRDTVSGTTTRASVDSAGLQGDGDSGAGYGPSISADGRYVAFMSDSTNLVSGDTNGTDDAFVRDTVANTTTRASVDSAGLQSNDYSEAPSISGDGGCVAFTSWATNLVPGDTNDAADVFVRGLWLPDTGRVTGTVTSGGGTTPRPGIVVYFYKLVGSTWTYVGSTSTNASGVYAMTLPPETYHLCFKDPSGTYLKQCYDKKTTLAGGDPVVVGAGDTKIANADLVGAGQLIGKVTSGGGTTPRPGIAVYAYNLIGPTWTYAGSTSTNASGVYTLNLTADTYHVYFKDPSGAYLKQYWDNKTTLAAGDPVVVTAGGTATANADLTGMGHITGTVTSGGGVTPRPGIAVYAYNLVGSTWTYAGSTTTNASGVYTLNLMADTYHLYFKDPTGNYLKQYWNGKTTLAGGNPIVVTADSTETANADLRGDYR